MIRISQSEDKNKSRIASAVVSDDHHHYLDRSEGPAHDQNVPDHLLPPLEYEVFGSQLVTEDGSQTSDDQDVGSAMSRIHTRGLLLLENTVLKVSGSQSGHGGAIKRACDDDAETDDDLVALTSSSLNHERRSPAKKPKFVVTYREMREFFALLSEESIQQFLKRDSCCLISDKYALAMVFTYFKRAKFYLNEYTRTNFYLALYLASDIEEDVDDYKYEIFPWALGRRWRSKFTGFLRKRDALLRRIGYRAIVSRKCCEEVMSLVPDHSVWKRERSEDHGGATRAYLINRGKRYLSIKANMGYEELNFPRGPYEKPRPCLLCMLNRGCQSIAAFNPTLSSGIIGCCDAADCSDPACRACPLSVSSLEDAGNTTSSGIDSSTYLVSADLTSVSSDHSEEASKNGAKLNNDDESQEDDEGIQSSSSGNEATTVSSGAKETDKYVSYLSSDSQVLGKKAAAAQKPFVKVSSHQDCAIVSTSSCAKSASANHLHSHNENRMSKISNHSLNRLKTDDAHNKFPSSNKFCDRKQSASDLENTSFGAVSVYDSFFDESCYYEPRAFDPNVANINTTSDHVHALPPVAHRPTVKTSTAAVISASKTTKTVLSGYKYPSTTSVGHLLVQDVMTSDEDIIDDDDYYSNVQHLGAGAYQTGDGDYESDDVFASNDVNATVTRTALKLKVADVAKKEPNPRRRQNYSYSTTSEVKQTTSNEAITRNPMVRAKLTTTSALDQQVPTPPAKC